MSAGCRWRHILVLCLASWVWMGVVQPVCGAGLTEGQPAPAFVLEDVRGQAHDVGKVQAPLLLLYFCDLESKPSRDGLVWLNRFAASHGSAVLQVWAVTLASKERAREVGSRLGLGFPVLPDTRGVSELYDAQVVLPMLYVIENGKRILRVLTGTGKTTEERLRQLVDARVETMRAAAVKQFEELKVRGIQAYEDRRLEAASRDLEKALSIQPDRDCYRYLAFTWFELNEDAKVEQTLEAAIAAFPRDPQFHEDSVQFHLKRDDPKRARDALERGLSRFPRDSRLVALKARVDEALKELSAASRVRTLPESPIKKTVETPEQKAKNLFKLAKQENGKLTWDDCLARKALQRAESLVRMGTFDHKDPATGKNPSWDLVKTCHKAAYAGENLSRGEGQTSRAIHTAFMQSSSHRKNILDKRFTLMGVGCHENICVELFAGF